MEELWLLNEPSIFWGHLVVLRVDSDLDSYNSHSDNVAPTMDLLKFSYDVLFIQVNETDDEEHITRLRHYIKFHPTNIAHPLNKSSYRIHFGHIRLSMTNSSELKFSMFSTIL